MAEPTKWQYRIEVLDPEPPGERSAGADAFERQLNVYGQDGWELVTVSWKENLEFLAYMKRPIPKL